MGDTVAFLSVEVFPFWTIFALQAGQIEIFWQIALYAFLSIPERLIRALTYLIFSIIDHPTGAS